MMLNVAGYNAKDIESYHGFFSDLKEKLERVKAFIDLTMEREPNYPGETMEIK
jgi:vancomycin permeability regulator SanA